MPKATISAFLPEVLDAIYHYLDDYIKVRKITEYHTFKCVLIKWVVYLQKQIHHKNKILQEKKKCFTLLFLTIDNFYFH